MKPLVVILMLLAAIAASCYGLGGPPPDGTKLAIDPCPPKEPDGVEGRKVRWLPEVKTDRRKLNGQKIRLRIYKGSVGRKQKEGLDSVSYDIGEQVRMIIEKRETIAKFEEVLKEDVVTLLLVVEIARGEGDHWIRLEDVQEEPKRELPEPNEVPLRHWKEVHADGTAWKGKVVKVWVDPKNCEPAKDAGRYGESYSYMDGPYATIPQMDEQLFNRFIKGSRRRKETLYVYRCPHWGWVVAGNKWDRMKKRYVWE